MKIAVIGVGNMGAGVARRLMLHGHAVVVWDLSLERREALAADGAELAVSAQASAQEADVVITSLLGDESVLQSTLVSEGFMSAMKPGAVHLCITTISSECADQLAAAHRSSGTRFVSGPVAGRPDSAAAGQLVTYLAGDKSAVEYVGELVKAYAIKTIVLEGNAGLANAMKLCVNYTAISIIEVMGEIYAFAEKKGLDRKLLSEFFSEAFNRPALKMYAAKLRDNDTSSAGGFAMPTGLKDVNLMVEAAQASGVNFEVGAIIKRKMEKALTLGMTSADWSAISQVTRLESGIALPE